MVAKTFFGCVCCCESVSPAIRVDVSDAKSGGSLKREHDIHSCALVKVSATSIVTSDDDSTTIEFLFECKYCAHKETFKSTMVNKEIGDHEKIMQCTSCEACALVQVSHCAHAAWGLGLFEIVDDVLHLGCRGVGARGNSHELNNSVTRFIEELQSRASLKGRIKDALMRNPAEVKSVAGGATKDLDVSLFTKVGFVDSPKGVMLEKRTITVKVTMCGSSANVKVAQKIISDVLCDVIDDDIILGPSGQDHELNLWPHGELPLTLDASLPPTLCDIVRSAVAFLRSKTCLNVHIREPPTALFGHLYSHYVNIRLLTYTEAEDGIKGFSYIGFNPSMQEHGYSTQCIGLSPSANFRTVIHELLHACGVFHAHSHPDRDEYVLVTGELDNNFLIPKSSYLFLKDYDFLSVMHYQIGEFGNAEIRLRPKYQHLRFEGIGEGATMSHSDVQIIDKMYHKLSRRQTPMPANRLKIPVRQSRYGKRHFCDCFLGKSQGLSGCCDEDGSQCLFCSHFDGV